MAVEHTLILASRTRSGARSPARSSRASSARGFDAPRGAAAHGRRRELAEEHYAEHREKPFFGELVDFITSGPTLAFVLEGEGAIATARTTIGATNPADAGARLDPRRLRARDAGQPRARLRLARVGGARDRALVPRRPCLSRITSRSTARRGRRRTPSTRTRGRTTHGRRRRSPGEWRARPKPRSTCSPDVDGKDVVELGCGTAYFGAWLARRGARVVGVDVTPAQLETARRMEEEFGLGLRFVEANAEDMPLPDESFDLVLSEYGASIWCDPYKWIPEAARLLRDGGELVFLRNSTLAMLCATDERDLRRRRCSVRSAGCTSSNGTCPTRDRVLARSRRLGSPPARERLRADRSCRAVRRRARRRDHSYYAFVARMVGAVALRGDLARPSCTAADPRVDVAAAARDSRAARHPVRRRSARVRRGRRRRSRSSTPRGKARSVDGGGEQPVLGVDTVVVCDGRGPRQARRAGGRRADARALSGRTHEVVSGLCLRTPGWEELHREVTRVTFRDLTPRDIATYLAAGEWEGRAGSYAIQGFGAELVARIEGDYLNVVGLPGALLVRLLANASRERTASAERGASTRNRARNSMRSSRE